jgi:hypothetical protein
LAEYLAAGRKRGKRYGPIRNGWHDPFRGARPLRESFRCGNGALRCFESRSRLISGGARLLESGLNLVAGALLRVSG